MGTTKDTMLGRLVSALVSLPAEMLGTLVDLAKKLSCKNGEELHRQLKRLLRGEISILPRRWEKQDGVIRFNVIGNGLTEKQQVVHLKQKGRYITTNAQFILQNTGCYRRTESGKMYTITILTSQLFSQDDKIRAKAKTLGLQQASLELACLIRGQLSSSEIKDMGLKNIVVMHDPVKGADGSLQLLSVQAVEGWEDHLCAGCSTNSIPWGKDIGFAFIEEVGS